MTKYSFKTNEALDAIKQIHRSPAPKVGQVMKPSAARIARGENMPHIAAKPYPILPPDELDDLRSIILEVMCEVGLVVRHGAAVQAGDLRKSPMISLN